MLSNKFIRILIVVNGLIFLFLMSTVLYKEFISPLFRSTVRTNQGIIVGEEFENAIEDSLQLQSIKYNGPFTIQNSSFLYFPVYITTYDEARDFSGLSGANRSKYNIDYSSGRQQIINIVFTDENRNVINTLLERKGIVSDIEIKHLPDKPKNVDTTYNHLCYLIGFNDSNKDSKLDDNDDHDLYVSNLDGSNLTQISHDVDIVSYELDTKKSIINIRYKERTDEREEYKKIKFAKYDLTTGKWIDYEELNNHLLELEKLLITKPTN